MTKTIIPAPFFFLSLQNGLANPSTENWLLGEDKSNFVSVKIKTSMLFLILYLSCSNLWFVALIFKFLKAFLLQFLALKASRELKRMHRMFSSITKTLISRVSLMSTRFKLVADKFPEFAVCKSFSKHYILQTLLISFIFFAKS